MFPKFIASQFKKPSGLLGKITARIMTKGNRNIYDTLIKDLDPRPGEKLLEIGYGPGIGIHQIARMCESCLIHGVDFSRLMYKKASRYNKSFIDTGKVQLQHGDFLKIPFAANQFDKIFCLNVIYFWDELNEPLRKTQSLLKSGGIFYIYMVNASFLIEKKIPDSIFNKYSIDQVVEALQSAGFTGVEHYFNKGYYIKARK